MIKLTFSKIPAVVSGTKVWGAIGKKKQFVIVEDDGEFTASFRKLGSTRTVHIIDYDRRVSSFAEAEMACNEVAKDQ